MHTKLGWVLSGPAHSVQTMMLLQPSPNLVATHTLRVDDDSRDTDELNRTLRSFWELESLGIRDPENSVHEEFENSIEMKEGRYELSLPCLITTS